MKIKVKSIVNDLDKYQYLIKWKGFGLKANS